MPLEAIHKLAFKAAEAAHCAGDQGKYWEMHDRLFEHQKALEPWSGHAEAVGIDTAKFEECLNSGKYAPEVRKDMEQAKKVGITGTPGFFFAVAEPGKETLRTVAVLKGAKAFADFKSEIDRLLANPPPPPPAGRTGADAAPAPAPSGAAAPADDHPAPPPKVARLVPSVATKTFDTQTADAIGQALGTAPAGSPVWIAATQVDPRAVTRAEDLARLFTAAGWQVKNINRSALPLRAGTYVFAADEQPPEYVDVVRQALEAAGLTPSVATGYRQYYEERSKTDKNFRGFRFTPDQTFLLVLGRLP